MHRLKLFNGSTYHLFFVIVYMKLDKLYYL